MDNSPSAFSTYLQTKLASLSKERRDSIGLQISRAAKLGLIALVMENLKKKDKEKFEKVIQEMTEVDLLFFAYAHIKNFKQKYADMLEEIAQSLLATLEQEGEQYA